MKLLVGVDISDKMLHAARSQAAAQQVSDRVQFHTMDALGVLDFPNNSFDLVNQRLGESFVRTWEWRALLEECQRVTRPGGALRLTECDFAQSNSPALTRLFDPFMQALFNAGRIFTPDRGGILDALPHLLERNGLENVQTQTHLLVYRPGGPQWELFYEDIRLLFRSLLPFLHKWTRVPADYEVLYQQALTEMQEPDFVAKWTLLTAWGISPSKKR